MMHRQTRPIGRAILGASLLLAGCAANVGGSEPAPGTEDGTPQEPAASPSHEATHVSTEALRAESTGGACSPQACCFPSSGGGWQDNPLMDDLQAIGCGTPAPYQETSSAFWVWTPCPLRLETLMVVLKYRGTPYDAHFVENACLAVPRDDIAVVFDPTCDTCRPGGGLQ
jgi:hypothetical protein